MRLGDADRERLYEALSHHAAAGRIDLDELERRVAAVDAAASAEQAAEVLSDLPTLPAADLGEPGRPRWGRGHAEADRPQPDWHPTSERFRDPRTRRVIRVWVDGAGGRHYIPDDAS